MAIVTLAASASPPADCRGGAVSVGNFDGVHTGHAALVATLRDRAKAVGGPAVAVTFDPHPLSLLAPERLATPLTTPEDRAELLHAAGADRVVVLRATPELLRLEAREFLDLWVGERLRAKALVEGFNFGFGRRREGGIELLRDWCKRKGVGLDVVGPREVGGVVVSSSAIRAALERGDVATAARMLGRPYRLRGRVGTGARRGQTLGFPTANLTGARTLVPGDGVYAVRAAVPGGVWPGAANVGPNPTFGERSLKLEVHLIGYAGDLYGQPIAVHFVDRLRDVRPFAGRDDLVAQLRADVARAKTLAGEPAA